METGREDHSGNNRAGSQAPRTALEWVRPTRAALERCGHVVVGRDLRAGATLMTQERHEP